MKKIITILFICVAVILPLYIVLKPYPYENKKELHEEGEGMEIEVAARSEWMLKRLRDPNTGKIPDGIRQKELEFAATLPVHEGLDRKSTDIWMPRGPWNIGGRTRAIASDVTNENILVAGGVSGGIWRSTDLGKNWSRATKPDQLPTITSVAQDTRTGKTNVWYAGTGEFIGTSPSATGAYYAGNGLMKSTDGGLTWNPIASTANNTVAFDRDFDFVHNVVTNPAINDSDVVFAAVYGAIYRSVNGGQSWVRKRGGQASGNVSVYTDIIISKKGVIYAALSSVGPNRGVWRSTDNGDNWTNILPAGFPGTYDAITLGLAPSDENQLYVMAVTPNAGKKTKNFRGDEEWNSLWKYTYKSGDGSGTGGTWEDRSANIPELPGDFGSFNNQGGYNYIVRVKPDNPDVVFIAGTQLFRSTDGFKTSTKTSIIGGYAVGTTRPDFKLYKNHHPDQHNLIFLASSASKAISTHDGGISYTTDILKDNVEWESLNNGYLTTQFYTIAINESAAGDKTIIGGLQDNGTLRTNTDNAVTSWTQILSYDGAFCAIADNGTDYYVTKQEDGIYRVQLDAGGNRALSARIDPPNKKGYLFVNPFVLDPNDNKRLFMVNDSTIWRNDDVTQRPLTAALDSSRIPLNWTEMTNTKIGSISTVSVSKIPSGVMFFGTENGRVFKVANATTGNPVPQEITGAGFPAGFVNCIAVHPEDADKLIVVFSNYGIKTVFYTQDGGQNWTSVSGNIEQNPNGSGNGPSGRWAAYVKTDAGWSYLLGTSTGLYSASDLKGDSTKWYQLGAGTIGNVPVDMIKVRQSDGLVVVATHGLGVYSATITKSWQVNSVQGVAKTLEFSIYPNPATDIINIDLVQSLSGKTDIVIYDMLGKTIQQNSVSSGQTLETNVAALKKGIYIMEVKNGIYSSKKKFIKE